MDETGWLAENGRVGSELRYRTMDSGNIIWTEDVNKAIRFARRQDAEMFSMEDEDVWAIEEHLWCDGKEKQSGMCECSVSICDTVIHNNRLQKELWKIVKGMTSLTMSWDQVCRIAQDALKEEAEVKAVE